MAEFLNQKTLGSLQWVRDRLKMRETKKLMRLRSNIWMRKRLPECAQGMQTMLTLDEIRLLWFLANEYFQNEGYIVDAGCFLGGSTLSLADGLSTNKRFQKNPRKQVIHSYDLFEAEKYTIGWFFPEDEEVGASFKAVFEKNIAEYAYLVRVRPGNILDYTWNEGPIEVLFIDIAKHWKVCDHVMRVFFPSLIPRHSVIVQQDYFFHSWNGWLHVLMEYFSDYFDLVTDTYCNSAVFHYKKRIPSELLQQNLQANLSDDEIITLGARAAARFKGDQNKCLKEASTHYVGLRNMERAAGFK